MLCINPYRTGVEEFGCGKCVTCRFTKRRRWVGRLMLELQSHKHSCFVTLTFKEVPDDFPGTYMAAFMRSLRRVRGSCRYFGVAEYGTRSGRGHYHLALFGVSAAERCAIAKAWDRGFVHIGELNSASAHYLVKYALKDFNGEKPFVRMSLKPGIGALYVERMADSVRALVDGGQLEDVPAGVRVAGRIYPKGRYIRGLEREALGRDRRTPQIVRAEQIREYAEADPGERERVRSNGYQSALARLAIIKTKEKL